MFHRAIATVLLWAIMVLPTPALAGGIYYYLATDGKWYLTDSTSSTEYQPRSSQQKIGPLTPLKKRIHRAVHFYSSRFDVDPLLIKAIIRAESNFNPRAVSHAGAQGLMQLMPQTAKLVNVLNPFNPEDNIRGGIIYFQSLLNQFEGNVTLALAAYNAGPTAVARHRGVPPYQETKHYIRNVLRYYKELKSIT